MVGALLAFLTSKLLGHYSPSSLGKVSIDDLEQCLVVPLGQMNRVQEADRSQTSATLALMMSFQPKGIEGS